MSVATPEKNETTEDVQLPDTAEARKFQVLVQRAKVLEGKVHRMSEALKQGGKWTVKKDRWVIANEKGEILWEE